MNATKRQANFELLRIVAMFMVITLHYLNYSGGLLELQKEPAGKQLIGTAMEALSIFAVNVYVLISGYFLVETRFRVKRLLVLVGQVLFYALLIPVIMLTVTSGIFFGGGIDFYQMMGYVFPIQTEHYWFATAYVLLYLFSPILNGAVKQLSKRQLQIAIICLLIAFSGIKSVSPIAFATDRFGYDYGWFICVYLVAAYMRLYGITFFAKRKWAWLTYFSCVVGIYGMVLVLYLLVSRLGVGALSYFFGVPFHYNNVFVLIGAVALFYGFSHLEIKKCKVQSVICKIAPFTFGVYLLHEHIDIRTKWVGMFQEILGGESASGVFAFLLQWMVAVVVVFVAGIFIDWVRYQIFGFVGRRLRHTKLNLWIAKIDQDK